MTGIDLIAAERQRQIDEEGYTAEHDRGCEGHLATAAAAYAMWAFGDIEVAASLWPWDVYAFKPGPDQLHDLVRAGALIAAAIDALRQSEGE